MFQRDPILRSELPDRRATPTTLTAATALVPWPVAAATVAAAAAAVVAAVTSTVATVPARALAVVVVVIAAAAAAAVAVARSPPCSSPAAARPAPSPLRGAMTLCLAVYRGHWKALHGD